MVQPVDQICYKMIEIIKQNFFNSVDFYLGPNFLFSWPDEYFQLMTSPILNPKIQHIKKENPRKCYFLHIVWMSFD